MQYIWDVITSYTTSSPSTPVNLELFWDRWLALSKPTSAGDTTIDSHFPGQVYTLYADSWESDNDISAANSYIFGFPQMHTLYGDSDLDYVAFSASAGVRYTVKTENLLNGADTKITLFKPDGTSQASNDNASGLSSSLTFTAASTGNYSVKTESSSSRPSYAGRYGTYTLTINSQ